jgi:hypothetical protein
MADGKGAVNIRGGMMYHTYQYIRRDIHLDKKDHLENNLIWFDVPGRH